MMEIEIKKGKCYYGDHVPSGESWVLVGINVSRNLVCAAGYPPTEAKLSDCENIKEAGDLSRNELEYRTKYFGKNWDN